MLWELVGNASKDWDRPEFDFSSFPGIGERRLAEGITAEADELLPRDGLLFGDIGEVLVGTGVCTEVITWLYRGGGSDSTVVSCGLCISECLRELGVDAGAGAGAGAGNAVTSDTVCGGTGGGTGFGLDGPAALPCSSVSRRAKAASSSILGFDDIDGDETLLTGRDAES